MLNMNPTEYLYLDNFRGFEKALIPFRQVTFLVGENSSGKTSVLSAINLIHNYTFWNDVDFDTDNQHLGGFTDLVTEGTEGNSFTIGTARYSYDFQDKPVGPAILFASFDSLEGLPRLAKITLSFGDMVLQTYIENDAVYRRSIQLDQADKSNELSEKLILKIARFHNEPSSSTADKLDIANVHGLSGGMLFHMSAFQPQIEPADKKAATQMRYRRNLYSLFRQPHETVWLAPIRTKPRRTYDATKKAFTPEGDHTPYLLKKQLSSKESAKHFRTLITDLGRNSHLFEDIKIRPFGRGDATPFEVQIKLGAFALSISNVGYGVSQILPILVEVITRPPATSFHIQQPEVHVHPRAQAALGTLFHLLAREEGKSFVIETHSDFLIDRYRAAMSSDSTRSNAVVDTSVVFFSRQKSRNVARELCFSPKGEYPDDQPKEFREFFIQEQMRVLGI
jgi:predicted ATPase